MIYMKQPCFTNIVNKPCGQTATTPPSLVENVIGVGSDWQLVPGSFWVDLAAAKAYYVPHDDDDMATAEIVMPVAEELIVGRFMPVICRTVVKGAVVMETGGELFERSGSFR